MSWTTVGIPLVNQRDTGIQTIGHSQCFPDGHHVTPLCRETRIKPSVFASHWGVRAEPKWFSKPVNFQVEPQVLFLKPWLSHGQRTSVSVLCQKSDIGLKLVNFNAERLYISQNESGKGEPPVALPPQSLGSVTTMSSSFPYAWQLGPWLYPEDRTNVLNAITELTVHPVAKKPKI